MTSVTGTVGGFGLARGYLRSSLWVMPALFVVLCVLTVLDGRWGHRLTDPRTLVPVLVAVVVLATHVAVVRPWFAPSRPTVRLLAALVLTVSVAAPVVAGLASPRSGAVWFVVPGVALSVLLATLGWHRRWLGAGGVLAVAGVAVATAAGFPLPGGGWVRPLLLLSLLVVPALIDLGSVWLVDVVDRLDRARSVADELATTRERARIAAELHDVQGHSLHAIALHAELTERLVAADPETAARHARTVRTLAADALAETRALVRGYRDADLSGEVRNAAGLLRAAGAEATVTGDPATVPAVHAVLLGPVVREAATNVLRHSIPTSVTLTVRRAGDRTELEVRNDGVVPGRPDPHGGAGLAGMRDRIGKRGGRVEAGPDGDGGWRLAVVLLGGADEPAGPGTAARPADRGGAAQDGADRNDAADRAPADRTGTDR